MIVHSFFYCIDYALNTKYCFTNNIPNVNGSMANFPDLRDHDHVFIAAHITANALITPMAI